uniref:Uncharacterized protein n=1 Tax=Knipowitschia caucasica TaxID=637954 RepID=A0AAV2LLC8_KNICA
MAAQNVVEIKKSLTKDILTIISDMREITIKLTWAVWMDVLMVFLLVLVVVFWILWALVSPVVGVLSMIGLVLALGCVVWCRPKLPSPVQAVSKLDALSIRLNDRVNALKETLQEERDNAWFPSLNSRWRSLEELEVLTQDLMILVSRFNPEFHSDMKQKLGMCESLMGNISP